MRAETPKHTNPFWTLDDIAWDRFDPAKVDPDVLKLIKAASLVEYNGGHYADYLCQVFHDDPEFQSAAQRWAAEEVQHGRALGRWASLADPAFDFGASFDDFSETIQLPRGADASVRGSRCSELIARCVVEVGTSSYYAALSEAVEEPVLKEICRRIAGDELRHYKLFYDHMKRYRLAERPTLARRAFVAAWRVGESEDDELAYAYHAANIGGPYERRRAARAYYRRAFGVYRPHHLERAVAMIFKAIGLSPQSRLCRFVGRAFAKFVAFRADRLSTAGA